MANIKKTEEMLKRSIFEVFEKMFFIFAEPSRDEARFCQMRASISFDGPFKGEMQLRITHDLLRIMAKNMLNFEDHEVTDSVEEDCIKEAINMVCGNFLRKVEPDHIFDLSIPTYNMISDESPDEERDQSEMRLTFDAEDNTFEVRLWAPVLFSEN
ncbi:MAG: chemotaxis protein CheX [Deltaproteobacteria bacterium]|nr:chemotaxis protein CheX [Deltaproteobacteria bacterium]